MSLTIHNICEMLDTVRLFEEHKPTLRNYVKKTFQEKPVKQARMPNYENVKNICILFGLVKIDNNKMALTNLGVQTLELYGNKSPEFKDFFIKNMFFGPQINREIFQIFDKFHTDDNHGMWYPKQEIYGIVTIPDILPILYETGLFEKQNGKVEINPKYIQLIGQNDRKITQKMLEAQLENQKIIGNIAEELVLAFEQKRLADAGHTEEASKIDRISDRFANAGYDIESFTSNNGHIHKIYIEVKGSSGLDLDFYLSSNELAKSKEHGDRYWIYFVPGINIRTHGSSERIITIQDPSKTIFDNSDYIIKTEKYHISKKYV